VIAPSRSLRKTQNRDDTNSKNCLPLYCESLDQSPRPQLKDSDSWKIREVGAAQRDKRHPSDRLAAASLSRSSPNSIFDGSPGLRNSSSFCQHGWSQIIGDILAKAGGNNWCLSSKHLIDSSASWSKWAPRLTNTDPYKRPLLNNSRCARGMIAIALGKYPWYSQGLRKQI
jgi:hypothetical protein